MNMKVVSSLVILLLGSGIGAGAATLTLSEKAADLEMQFGNSIEHFRNDMEVLLKEEGEKQKASEMTRLDSTTHDYLNAKLQQKKEQLLEEQKAKIQKETDDKITELERFIDNQLAN